MLEKKIKGDIRESIVLEREADELDKQGKPAAADRSRSRARDLRYRADRVQTQAVLLAQQPGKLKCMYRSLVDSLYLFLAARLPSCLAMPEAESVCKCVTCR